MVLGRSFRYTTSVKFFRKKEQPTGNLRRRFHLSQLSKRKKNPIPKGTFANSGQMRSRRKQTPSWLLSLRRALIIFGAAGLFLGSVYLIFFSSFFTVTNVSVEAHTTSIPTTALSPFLNRMKGRNLLFLRTEALTRDIEKKFKHEVLLARVEKKFPRSVSLVIKEHPVVLNVRVITGDTVQTLSTNSIGYAVETVTPNDMLPTLIIRNPKNPEIYVTNSYILEAETLNKFTTGFTKFAALFDLGIEFGEWIVRAREFHIKTDKGFVVWLDLTQDIEAQLEKLKRALVTLDIYNEPLEYIDLRIAGGESEKLIFKRR